ncbi:MAG TPA: DEAD/DEAH box helicase, partial [Dehalococcoidia bacterium]|nr:DEAD/DEAH box helicase [Dehalococcoidia bacterium]
CCFNAGNIKSVVPQFVEKYPNKELIIYCDNDFKNDIQDDVDVISTYAGRAYHDHLISYSKDENGYIFQNLEKSKNAGLRQGIACASEFGIKYCVPFFDNAGVVYNPHCKMPSDFEDLLNITGKEETLRQLRENVFPKPYGSEDKLSATDGIAMLDEAIESWYESDGSLILKITTGTGKTTTVVNKIIKIYEKNPNIRIRMFLPTKRLARDIHNELVEKCPSIKSVVIYGRGHEYAPNKTMCAKDHVVSISSSKGQPVYFQFCSHPTDGQCEHFNDCQYIKQYTDTGNMNVVLQTHATLPNSSIGYLESKLPSPDAVIIDEKCHDYFHGHFELTEDQFLMPLNQNNEVVSDSLKTGISSFDENRYKI